LNLVPFAGIAFLWFIGVVRDRMGAREDRLFATVFLGSGLLFLAMLFASAAVAGGLIIAYSATPNRLITSGTYGFGRAITYQILNVYAIKMAGVFVISLCTISVQTGLMPRWMTFLGYGLAFTLLLSTGLFSWIALVFPAWVLIVSVYILIENYRGRAGTVAPQPAEETG
jgi:hypothetical protein